MTLKQVRRDAGLSQTKAAERLREALKRPIKQTDVSVWENGRTPKVDVVRALATVYGVSDTVIIDIVLARK